MGSIAQHQTESLRFPTESENPWAEEFERDDTTSKAGTKRLFSNRHSRQIDDSEYAHNGRIGEDDLGQEIHSEKRHRNSDWPLPASSPASQYSIRPGGPHAKRHVPASPSSRGSRRAVSLQRSSRFQEGSMNDRVSNMPPTPFLDGEDEYMEDYDPIEAPENRGRKRSRMAKSGRRNESATATISSANQDSNRYSIFKFGKSIAANFNPTNWRIWSSKTAVLPSENEEEAQLRVLRERQSQAEKRYREMKESGALAAASIKFPPKQANTEEYKPKHDSGIEFDPNDTASSRGSKDLSMSIDDKRKGRVYLEPPRLSGSMRGESPMSYVSTQASSTSSPNKSSFSFKRTSFTNLKNTLTGRNSSTNLAELGQQARRIPSRKDLQKQQKLVKRVSDLEGKLEAARKQLTESLGEPLPVSQDPLFSQGSYADAYTTPPVLSHRTSQERVTRRPFVPGALPTLPSERLLAGYVPDEDDEEETEDPGIGQAISVDRRLASKHSGVSEPSSQNPFQSAPSPAWLGPTILRPRSSSSQQAKETEQLKQQDGSILIGMSVADSTQAAAAESSYAMSEPSTRVDDPNDSDYVGPRTKAKRVTKARKVIDDPELTPKAPVPQTKSATSTPRKRSRFEGYANDGGSYIPSDSEASVIESVKRSGGSKKTSPPNKQGRRMANEHNTAPRKLQKISPSQGKKLASSGPPSRVPPPPPTHGNNATTKTSQHPPRNSSLQTSWKSPPPPHRQTLSKPPPLPITRQQSASPPPSSAFTGVDAEATYSRAFPASAFAGQGSDLVYNKPSAKLVQKPDLDQMRTFADEGDDLEYAADPNEDYGVPPMPKMPANVRLASGEVVSTSTRPAAPVSILKNGKNKKKEGSVVSNTSRTSAGRLGKRESVLFEKPAPAQSVIEKQDDTQPRLSRDAESFNWDKDVF